MSRPPRSVPWPSAISGRSRRDRYRRDSASTSRRTTPRSGAQPSWRRIYLAPSYRTGATQHAYALQVLAEILAGSAGSRLNQALVLDKGLALTVGAGYAPSAIGLADFGVYATPKPGVSVADLEAAVDAE